MTNYFMCLEPWNGSGISKKDTGFGNRILHWNYVYYISSFFDDCTVLVQEQYWPELEFLCLPNTSTIDISFSEVRKTYSKVTYSNFQDLLNFKDQICKTSQNYYFENLINNTPPNVLEFGIKHIKFKDDVINNFFKQNFSNLCSLHLRRGIGTIPSKGFIHESLKNMGKEKFQNYLKDSYFKTYHKPMVNYTIFPDSVYFYIIDKIISKNNDQKIYISSDISFKYYDFYIKKYPNNIVVQSDYIQNFLNFFDLDYLEKKIKNKKYTAKQTLINLFDLFSLSHSKLIISDNYSTWAAISDIIYKKNKNIYPMDYIMKENKWSINQFKKNYNYYPEYLNNPFMEKNRLSNNSSTLLDIIEEWYFDDNEKSDILNLIDQIEDWISNEKNTDMYQKEEYIKGWNDCLNDIIKKLK